jgi:hypothetical protein
MPEADSFNQDNSPVALKRPVPAGFIGGIEGKETPDFPLGLTFAGRA